VKNTSTSQGRSLAILSATLVIVMLGFGIAIPLTPFYIIHFNASGTALGLMMALYSLMQFIFAPVWGRLSDRIGRKPVLLIGIGGFALSFLLQGLAQNLIQFMLVRTLAGILSSATLPTAMAYVADTTTPEERSKGVGMLGASMGVGMIFGPMLGGFLTHVNPSLPASLATLLQVTTDPSTGELINLSIPFFGSALLALLALPFVIFMLPESLAPDARVLHAPKEASRLGALGAALRGPMGLLFILAFLLAFSLAMMEGVLALYGKERFIMGPSQIGLLMGALGIVSVIQQGVLIGPLTRRYGEERIIQWGLVIGVLGFAAMALAPTRGLFIGATLFFNAGNMLLQPSVTSLISKRAQNGQGAVMGINQSFQSLGRGVGPLWAGIAFDVYATLAFWTGALVQAVALVYALRTLAPAKSALPLAPASDGVVVKEVTTQA
jgi:MFS family permease